MAGREAGLKINIPRLVKEVLLSAVRAGEEAANMAKAEGDEAQAKEMEKILVGCCSQAASHEGETEACKATEEQLEVFILENFDKICEEAGALKGREIFGDFGAQVGVESGLIAGRKAVFDLAMGKIKENLKEDGKLASFSQAEIESKEKLSTENLQGLMYFRSLKVNNCFYPNQFPFYSLTQFIKYPLNCRVKQRKSFSVEADVHRVGEICWPSCGEKCGQACPGETGPGAAEN